jgi:hypothetical protein
MPIADRLAAAGVVAAALLSAVLIWRIAEQPADRGGVCGVVLALAALLWLGSRLTATRRATAAALTGLVAAVRGDRAGRRRGRADDREGALVCAQPDL